jgi:hypothetical protein
METFLVTIAFESTTVRLAAAAAGSSRTGAASIQAVKKLARAILLPYHVVADLRDVGTCP